jgi:hypothetical protein
MTYQQAKAMLSMGPSRPTLYQVILPRVGGGVNDYLRFYAKATRIPEVTAERITTISHEAIGVERQTPTRLNYGKPFEITVLENASFNTYKGIRQWFDRVVQNGNRQGGGGGPSQSQRPAYYTSMVEDITLIKLENPPQQNAASPSQLRKVMEVTFKNAYPVRMGAVNLASDAFDSQTEFTVAFTYETYSYR